MKTLKAATSSVENTEATRKLLNDFLNEWHDDAAHSRQAYFDKIAADGIYIGTDRTERWNREELKIWAAEYFAKTSAWEFTTLSRNIMIAANNRIAWFDEQLSSSMGVLQASGVIGFDSELPEIFHYQLSLAVPNGLMREIAQLIQGADVARG